MKVSFKKAFETAATLLNANLVPMIHGHAGQGKSALARQLAEVANLQLIDIRLSQYDACEIKGLYHVTPNAQGAKKTQYIPIEDFPIAGDKLPEGKDGWLLFLDELPDAPQSVQKAAYRVILDREVGNKPLHESVSIMGAGNMVTSGTGTRPMGAALKTRMCHIEMETNHSDWIEWAYGAGIDPRITGYLQWKKGDLNTFDSSSDDHTHRNNRTWEFLSKAITSIRDVDMSHSCLVEACIGQAGSMDFIGFTMYYSELPTLDQILDNPEIEVKKIDEPTVQYALAGMLGDAMNADNAEPLIKFSNKHLGKEFQYMFMKAANIKSKGVLSSQSKPYMEWMKANLHLIKI